MTQDLHRRITRAHTDRNTLVQLQDELSAVRTALAWNVDPQYSDLRALGWRPALPDGWTYETVEAITREIKAARNAQHRAGIERLRARLARNGALGEGRRRLAGMGILRARAEWEAGFEEGGDDFAPFWQRVMERRNAHHPEIAHHAQWVGLRRGQAAGVGNDDDFPRLPPQLPARDKNYLDILDRAHGMQGLHRGEAAGVVNDEDFPPLPPPLPARHAQPPERPVIVKWRGVPRRGGPILENRQNRDADDVFGPLNQRPIPRHELDPPAPRFPDLRQLAREAGVGERGEALGMRDMAAVLGEIEQRMGRLERDAEAVREKSQKVDEEKKGEEEKKERRKSG